MRKFLVFRGRASRKEYWMFVLVTALINVGVLVLAVSSETDSPGQYLMFLLLMLHLLAIQLPAMSISVRRLHDFGASGWWVLVLWVIPFSILVLIRSGNEGDNKYGPPSRFS
ncbi:MAG: DUF805 domain-containing protein [Gemmatimonadota bacterium]|nr:DUF805 domain-containing protein [Gemmatimonadota bacterium]